MFTFRWHVESRLSLVVLLGRGRQTYYLLARLFLTPPSPRPGLRPSSFSEQCTTRAKSGNCWHTKKTHTQAQVQVWYTVDLASYATLTSPLKQENLLTLTIPSWTALLLLWMRPQWKNKPTTTLLVVLKQQGWMMDGWLDGTRTQVFIGFQF